MKQRIEQKKILENEVQKLSKKINEFIKIKMEIEQEIERYRKGKKQ